MFNLENFKGAHFHFISDEYEILPNISPIYILLKMAHPSFSKSPLIKKKGGGMAPSRLNTAGNREKS